MNLPAYQLFQGAAAPRLQNYRILSILCNLVFEKSRFQLISLLLDIQFTYPMQRLQYSVITSSQHNMHAGNCKNTVSTYTQVTDRPVMARTR